LLIEEKFFSDIGFQVLHKPFHIPCNEMFVGPSQLVIPVSLQVIDLGMDKGASVMNKMSGEASWGKFHFLIKKRQARKNDNSRFWFRYVRS
jgi:hypothetical protein